jgi:uncharacterized cupin superfamily protein
MQAYNVILLYNEIGDKILMCERRKPPYQGLRNLVGGKVEPGEESSEAAYRELYEEASISRDMVDLLYLMDFTYYNPECRVEVYAGRLSHDVTVKGDENDLLWVSADDNFFDMTRYAGEGNIGHMVEIYKQMHNEHDNRFVHRAEQVEVKTKSEHSDYAYTKRNVVSRKEGRRCSVTVYEVPPGKAAYPYHYHLCREEVFYILQGEGVLRTPQGEQAVGPGDFCFFPESPSGAHKLCNASATETLVYIDFGAGDELDVALYPDSGKLGIWGKDINRVYRQKDDVQYYDRE